MKALLLALLLGSTANADLIKIQYGVGISEKETQAFDTRHKSLNLGLYKQVAKSLSYNINIGYLGDRDVSTGYICGQFGTSVNPISGIFVENYFGPCAFSSRGTRLSGWLQFATNLGIGFRDPESGSEIGINWKHFSNAGISKPNKGRDLVLLSLGFGI